MVETQSKAKLRMQIESLLIEINEEMYALSDELARAFLSQSHTNLSESDPASSLMTKAKEFEKRKVCLVKRIQLIMGQEPALRILKKFDSGAAEIRSRSISPVDKVERSRSRGSSHHSVGSTAGSKYKRAKNMVPLRSSTTTTED